VWVQRLLRAGNEAIRRHRALLDRDLRSDFLGARLVMPVDVELRFGDDIVDGERLHQLGRRWTHLDLDFNKLVSPSARGLTRGEVARRLGAKLQSEHRDLSLLVVADTVALDRSPILRRNRRVGFQDSVLGSWVVSGGHDFPLAWRAV
jgi:hypothetical protein